MLNLSEISLHHANVTISATRLRSNTAVCRQQLMQRPG